MPIKCATHCFCFRNLRSQQDRRPTKTIQEMSGLLLCHFMMLTENSWVFKKETDNIFLLIEVSILYLTSLYNWDSIGKNDLQTSKKTEACACPIKTTHEVKDI